jgi:hypothetical protein
MNNEKMPTPLALLEAIELGEKFHTAEVGAAQIWQFVPNDEGRVVCSLWDSFPDIYDGLEAFANSGEVDTVAVAVVTSGWAAPMPQDHDEENDDEITPPSKHPARRRVSLVALRCADGGSASRIHFADTGENVDDHGDARGALAEALGDALDAARSTYTELEKVLQDILNKN